MSTLGTYSFLPWLRQGLANQITAADFDPGVEVRATLNVPLEARGENLGGGTSALPVAKPVALFGPGDIVGIERRAIVRTEPRDWITNFEPNYLPQIEFYDEDFPWRYTPAAPDLGKGRLRPWITLIVLEETEFKDGKDMQGKPLPYVEVANLSGFPRADELWAWAHVHVNRDLAADPAEFVSSDMNAVTPKLQAALNENPDLGYSRLICPRKLAENRSYHAFVIPTFEAGRRAGLGLDLADVVATASAWSADPRPQGNLFPYYYRWFFRTGANGDFETLVRLLVPKPVDPRVGTREMDVQAPAPNVRGVDHADLGGILKLGGALRPPAKVPAEPPDKYELWDDPFPRPLQEDLARLINLPDTYQAAGDPDPIIAPPLYGTWHALTKRVLTERNGDPIVPNDNWVHRLNLDPRFRVPAGFGTRVIQDQQEKFMNAAWEQVGKVLEAQRRIRFAQFGLLTSRIWYDKHLLPVVGVSRQQALLLMAPLQKRVLSNGVTMHHALTESFVQPAMTSAALRRIVRPRGRLLRALPFTAAKNFDQLLERVNAGEINAAPPKVAPPGVLTIEQAAEKFPVTGAPPAVLDLLRNFPQLPIVALGVAILLALLFLIISPLLGVVVAVALIAAGVFVYRLLTRWKTEAHAAEFIGAAGQTPEAIDELPTSPNFTITEPGSNFIASTGASDSVEAARFKIALRDAFANVQAGVAASAVPPKRTLDLAKFLDAGIKSIDPGVTIPRRVLAGIFVPPRLAGQITVRPHETFIEPMAYPVLDEPMYKPLVKLSDELFLPNINLIEQNSITLLETNQRFIESYMVGLNHEFARELLWREYPTDQRGSSFRQFWEVGGVYDDAKLDPEILKEKLRDIPPIHRWPKNSKLGSHDNREQPGQNEEELVLVIRGELLKRYPTAVIYAHRADWQRDPAGAINNKVERRLAPLNAAEEANPPKSKVLTPLYEAKVDPDIYFFGFDLTVEKAKGGTGENPNDDPGWFFVIKERPGEPRFGLDNEKQPHLQVWNDLAWPDVQPGAPGSFIEIASAPASFPLQSIGTADDEKTTQQLDDKKVAWSRDMSSAELAYILFQAPVLVAVHATEMLPK